MTDLVRRSSIKRLEDATKRRRHSRGGEQPSNRMHSDGPCSEDAYVRIRHAPVYTDRPDGLLERWLQSEAEGRWSSSWSLDPATVAASRGNGRCRLLELPAEIREQIWMHTVTEWMSTGSIERIDSTSSRYTRMLQVKAIRMDRFNRPSPPAVTRVSHQLRAETLHLYYELNMFEFWRPLFWLKDWSQSTFVDWLLSLGLGQTKWLRKIILLYKHENELEHDVEAALREQGFELESGVIVNKQELSEYEMCFEGLGLPRHFGKRRRWDRWLAATAS